MLYRQARGVNDKYLSWCYSVYLHTKAVAREQGVVHVSVRQEFRGQHQFVCLRTNNASQRKTNHVDGGASGCSAKLGEVFEHPHWERSADQVDMTGFLTSIRR